MLTTKYVKDNLERIKKSLARRKSNYPLDTLLQLDTEYKKIKLELDEMRHQHNKLSSEISEMRKKGESISIKAAEVSDLKNSIESKTSEAELLEKKIEEMLWNMPNILDDSVPDGNSSDDNVEIRRWGDVKKKEGESHEQILSKLGMLDIDRAAKVAGSRFYYLKGDLVMLEMALVRFGLDELSRKGYLPITPPFMIRKKYFMGAAPIGTFEEALYKVGEANESKKIEEYEHVDDDLFLIGTAEHAIAAMHAGEVFSGKELPLRYVGVSPCFRREAGSHGKDTKGIFRVHQFYKIEQFIFAKDTDSWKYIDELTHNGEELLQKLGIPYRVIALCTGDIGAQVAKTFDVEGYMPGQKNYRELQSHSNCIDWQSLRLDIRYDENGERRYVHTLNGTGLAVERTMVAIIENYANNDGSITVPDVLVPYMNGKEKIGIEG
ncbi:MAG: serine--tRNA ligase [Candidatus Micrarchaeia archaeon]